MAHMAILRFRFTACASWQWPCLMPSWLWARAMAFVQVAIQQTQPWTGRCAAKRIDLNTVFSELLWAPAPLPAQLPPQTSNKSSRFGRRSAPQQANWSDIDRAAKRSDSNQRSAEPNNNQTRAWNPPRYARALLQIEGLVDLAKAPAADHVQQLVPVLAAQDCM